MRNWKYAFLALCIAATTAACADNRTPEDRPASAPAGTPGAAGTSGTAAGKEAGMLDRNFVTEMIADGHAEVELGKLAQQKATNRRVKEFAAMMVKDHQRADAELKTVARETNVDMADVDDHMDDSKDIRDRLAKLSGAEFDREYIRQMVDDHEKVVNDVEGKQDSDNAHIKQWAAKTLPTLKKHLEQARQIQNSLENRSGS